MGHPDASSWNTNVAQRIKGVLSGRGVKKLVQRTVTRYALLCRLPGGSGSATALILGIPA